MEKVKWRRLEDTSRSTRHGTSGKSFCHPRYLVSTGRLGPACDPSKFEEIVRWSANSYIQVGITDPSIFDDLIWMTRLSNLIVQSLENEGIVDTAVRLTDTEFDYLSPKITEFSQLVDPELLEVRKQLNPQLFEEVGRISWWREFLRKVAGGEEVENNISFLKSSFFRPTLLSLQAKFQQLASSLDGSEDSSTSSLHSSLSSPHTSLEALLDSSLRILSSSSPFRQESLQLLNILHSLLTSPLPPSHTKQFRRENFGPRLALVEPDNVSSSEIFDSSLFDEPDNEKLARSLVRCKSVCELVGAEKCILDIPNFIDRTVSALGTADSLLREAAFSLFQYFDGTSNDTPLLPHLWNRLRSAFRDGQREEQCALIRMSMKWIMDQITQSSLPPFPATEFDWDGFISADLRDFAAFVSSLILIWLVRCRLIKDAIGSDKTLFIILSFEQHKHFISRIVSIFDGTHQLDDDPQDCLWFISYCLLLSLLSNRDFHSTLTSFLTEHPELEAHTLLPHENIVFLLCHSSLNHHKPHQPPLDFLFERK
ncbi:hypothetical protein BLNAU_21616 [Blattamonas nauphoetae]|uniref:Uncharacterized protein n=1 Tax=Blattamonas nauphoetae TaxID=2049346 RepID=A0ABQ9WZN7_9EUKA|nr:hypothetical protein BLNAU_21616 [Blattamonas nauphoetae]